MSALTIDTVFRAKDQDRILEIGKKIHTRDFQKLTADLSIEIREAR